MGRTADVLAAAAAIVLGFLLLAVMLGVLLAVFGAFMIIRG